LFLFWVAIHKTVLQTAINKLSMDNLLERIQTFAEKAHGEQKRKYSGDPYIVHPVRVMNTCREYTGDNTILAAALLHDVLEDTPITKLKMKQFLKSVVNMEDADRILRLVTALTDVYTKEKFPLLNRNRRRLKETHRLGNISGDAQTVKYADIIDNTIDITQNDPDFAIVYLKECMNSLISMTDGNPELYQRALQTVEENMMKLNGR
jgi:(p)ppGpp synthase/HD superfamily hydrolase